MKNDRHGTGTDRLIGAMGVVALLVTFLTLVAPAWLEARFGLDLDGGDGVVERAVSAGAALVFLAYAVVVGLRARTSRSSHSATSASPEPRAVRRAS